jgi:hypothetical protein
MGYAGGGVNGALRWRDLALDELMPVDEEKEEAKKAIQARKMASGTTNSDHQQTQQGPLPQEPPSEATLDEEEGDIDEDDEDVDDEGISDGNEE